MALKLLVALCISPLNLERKGESDAFSIVDSLSFDIEVNIDDLISVCDMKDWTNQPINQWPVNY